MAMYTKSTLSKKQLRNKTQCTTLELSVPHILYSKYDAFKFQFDMFVKNGESNSIFKNISLDALYKNTEEELLKWKP